jgi:ketosteroid isomerase-like protein
MLRFMLLTGCVGLMAFATGCTQDTSAADLQAIKNQEIAWSKDAATKDVTKITAYYADDATLLLPNSPIVHGIAGIKSAFTGILQDKNFALTFTGEKAEVAGNLGYTQGNYSMTMSDAKGNPATDKGKYLTVWKKQADGSWKALEDMNNSDLPVGGN